MGKIIQKKSTINLEIKGPENSSAQTTKQRQSADRPDQILSIILIEPNSLLREALIKLLETRHSILASGSSVWAISATPNHQPDLILLGGDNANVLTRTLNECKVRYPTARRVVFDGVAGHNKGVALDAGANAYIGGDLNIEALFISLDLAILGTNTIYISNNPPPDDNSTTNLQIDTPEPIRASCQLNPEELIRNRNLSPREVAVLERLMHGDSNKVIARKFRIAEATVKVHIKAILRKINATNRTQAAIWAFTHFAVEMH